MSDYAFTRAGLVAPDGKTKWYEGTGILESAMSIKDGISSEDWFSAGANGVALGLSAVGAIMDPLQAVIAAGVGWLMEHLAILREPLDWLAGDPKAIEGQAATWRNIHQRIDDATDYYVDEVNRTTTAWASEAAEAYRHTARNHAQSARALGSISEVLAKMTLIAGGLVGVFRSTIRDLVADVVGASISKALQSVLVVTIPKVFAEVALLVGEYSAKILRLLKQLVSAIRKLTAAIPETEDILGRIGKSLDIRAHDAVILSGYRAQAAGSAMADDGSALSRYAATSPEIHSGHRAVYGDLSTSMTGTTRSAILGNGLQNTGQVADSLHDPRNDSSPPSVELPL